MRRSIYYYLVVIIVLFPSCLQGQESENGFTQIGENEKIGQNQDTESIFGEEIPFDPDTHMDMLQLLLRMNWYDNESVYIPQLVDTTLLLERTFFSDFQERIIRVYDDPSSRRNRTASISFNEDGLIDGYIVESTPQSEYGSTAKASTEVLHVDYKDQIIFWEYYRDDGLELQEHYRIQAFENQNGEPSIFIDSAFGRLRAIQFKEDYYYFFIGRRDESNRQFTRPCTV
jgi:hypothetical protein